MPISLKPLKSQVIVVFGASSGIGRSTALMAAERGAKVVAAARGRTALDSLVAETKTYPGEVIAETAEAADVDSSRAIADLAVRRATAFKLQRSKEPRQPGDDALFRPAEGDDRLHGVVTNLHR